MEITSVETKGKYEMETTTWTIDAGVRTYHVRKMYNPDGPGTYWVSEMKPVNDQRFEQLDDALLLVAELADQVELANAAYLAETKAAAAPIKAANEAKRVGVAIKAAKAVRAGAK